MDVAYTGLSKALNTSSDISLLMKSSTIIAIAVGIIIILVAAVIGISLMTHKPISTTTQSQTTTSQSVQVSSTTTSQVTTTQTTSTQTSVTTTVQQPLILKSTNLNLGILSSGTSATISTSMSIAVNKAGFYTFYLENATELEKVFSTFGITMTLSNSTKSTSFSLGWFLTPNPIHSNYTIYLPSGSYDIEITLSYITYSGVIPMNFSGTIVELGQTPFMNVSFTTQTQLPLGQSIPIKAVNFNLGLLSASNSGSVSNSLTSFSITKGGYYSFYLVNATALEKVFSTFDIEITLSNATEAESFSLGWYLSPSTLYNGTALYLSPGTYNLYVSLTYDTYGSIIPINFTGTVVKSGQNPFINVSFSTQTKTTQTSSAVSPINLYLGTLNPSDEAIISTSETVTINKGGYYTFYLVNATEFVRDFTSFAIGVFLSNSTGEIKTSLGWLFWPITYNSSTVYLSPGVYNLTMEFEYAVNKSVIPMNFSGAIVELGNKSLVNIGFSVQTQAPVIQQPISVKPINLNLGTLYPNASNEVSTLATITIDKGGEYLFQFANMSKIEGEYSAFSIGIIISNSTYHIGFSLGWLYWPIVYYNDTIYLSSGTYNVNVTIYYYVNSNATPTSFNGAVVELGNTPLVNASFVITQSTAMVVVPTVKVE